MIFNCNRLPNVIDFFSLLVHTDGDLWSIAEDGVGICQLRTAYGSSCVPVVTETSLKDPITKQASPPSSLQYTRHDDEDVNKPKWLFRPSRSSPNLHSSVSWICHHQHLIVTVFCLEISSNANTPHTCN